MLRNHREGGTCATLLASVIMTVMVPEVFMVVLGTEQVTPTRELDGVQEKDTSPLKLFCGATVTFTPAELPGCKETLAGLAVS
jgi:hypothetical protein